MLTLGNSYCITINEDRYSYLCKTFNKYGLSSPKKFWGLTSEPNGPMACLIAHMSIILMARCTNAPFVTVFEDDAYPRKDVAAKIKTAIDNRPDDCGILCFGRNGVGGTVIRRGDYMSIRERPYGSHAYICYRNAYDEYLESLEKQRIVDLALKSNNFKKSTVYWTDELLFIQKNIDSSCMSRDMVARKGRYFYPDVNRNNGLGVFDKVPNEFFEEDNYTIPCKVETTKRFDRNNPPEPNHFVSHMTWKAKCYVNTNQGIICRDKDIGKLTPYGHNVWKIDWEKYPNAGECLVYQTVDRHYYIMLERDIIK